MANTRKNRSTRKNRDSSKNRDSRKNRTERKNRKNQEGGKRKASDWAKSVKRVYEEMRRNNPKTRLGDAMTEASRRRKAGKL